MSDTPRTDAAERVPNTTFDQQIDKYRSLARQLERELSEANQKLACGGPLNSERWTLREFIAEMEKIKSIASDQTCVSFECFCWGASSLWHQTHRDNFKQIDRKPEALSAFVLEELGGVNTVDFPKQVLELLQSLKAELARCRHSNAAYVKQLDWEALRRELAVARQRIAELEADRARLIGWLPTGDTECPFDKSEPACERCGDSMYLHDGCEWSDIAGANVCDDCAREIVQNLYAAKKESK